MCDGLGLSNVFRRVQFREIHDVIEHTESMESEFTDWRAWQE